MNFGFTEEQNLLRDQVERFMQDTCPMTRVRELSGTGGFDAALWKQIGDLGWLGLLIPEAYGGLGLKWIDHPILVFSLFSFFNNKSKIFLLEKSL